MPTAVDDASSHASSRFSVERVRLSFGCVAAVMPSADHIIPKQRASNPPPNRRPEPPGPAPERSPFLCVDQGSEDGECAAASFERPVGLCGTRQMLFVADETSDKIRQIDLESRAVRCVPMSNTALVHSALKHSDLKTSRSALDVSRSLVLCRPYPAQR